MEDCVASCLSDNAQQSQMKQQSLIPDQCSSPSQAFKLLQQQTSTDPTQTPSYLEMQTAMLQAMSEQYALAIQRESISNNYKQESLVCINCGKECETCLDVFLSPELRTGEAYWENYDLINSIRCGACRYGCYCEATDIYLKNTVLWNVDQDVDLESLDIWAMVRAVEAQLEAMYPTSYQPNQGQEIHDIFVEITQEVSTSLATALESSQQICLNNGGVIRGVTMTIVIDAVFKAIVTNEVALFDLQSATQEAMAWIQTSVETSFKSGVSQLFNDLIGPIVAFGVIAIVFIILIVIFKRRQNVETVYVRDD